MNVAQSTVLSPPWWTIGTQKEQGILSLATLAASVLGVLRELNPRQPASEFAPLQSLVDHANSTRQFFTKLVGVFAGLGLLLAALGMYGVMSYSVSRQTLEIGIRMAPGESAVRVRKRVLASTLRLAGMEVAMGAIVSIIATRFVASPLYATPYVPGLILSN